MGVLGSFGSGNLSIKLADDELARDFLGLTGGDLEALFAAFENTARYYLDCIDRGSDRLTDDEFTNLLNVRIAFLGLLGEKLRVDVVSLEQTNPDLFERADHLFSELSEFKEIEKFFDPNDYYWFDEPEGPSAIADKIIRFTYLGVCSGMKVKYGDTGRNIFGYDRSGFNPRGFDPLGFDRNGIDFHGFDMYGYDADGFNFLGFRRDGTHRNGTSFSDLGFDASGYDENGFDRFGYNAAGYDANGLDALGLNKKGVTPDGLTPVWELWVHSKFDEYSYDDPYVFCHGRNPGNYRDEFGDTISVKKLIGFIPVDKIHEIDWNHVTAKDDPRHPSHFTVPDYPECPAGQVLVNRVDLCGYDEHGFNQDGVDRYGRDRDGFDTEGYDHRGFDRNGLDKNGFDKFGFHISEYYWNGKTIQGYAPGADAYSEKKAFRRQAATFSTTPASIETKYDTPPNASPVEGRDAFGYDQFGFDIEGYDRQGFNASGLDRCGRSRRV